ncbi:MAG: serine--tRNA ligase [Candidatus Pacebacteria bacterium]|jgi:seryl-tRNA synthetase|nr:serine--tRNA ligase [Candidatus Paceibacterota bacterium]MBT3511714.1 serine--tRNA ligase [Candidatus Paceibacterota bacterium]MBT4005143.1 serine--tRNA ligase [Candidatus Paceibacterota bacterium]MBT4358600.1 serine--tRNA ligase [Candidatus Paceibacterota bacterium]MBT4680740.1 serine--tRNA ligase [Candidatus Paceibacterota bacterium]
MLDINYIRNNKDLVKQATKDKQLDVSVVDNLLDVDEKRRQLIKEVDAIRQQINQNADKIKQQVQQGGKPEAADIEQGKKLKTQLKEIEPKLREIEEKFNNLILQVPNIPADDVPVGADESGNKVIKQVGDKPQFNFEPQPHDKLMYDLDLLDTQRAVKIAGFRSYFLKNEAVLLEQALLQYSLHAMIEHGFTPMTVPTMVNKEALVGTGYFPWGEDDHYTTQDATHLTGTAEVALTAYYQGETLTEKDLPIKMVGISPCFRREVGSHGKDTSGIIRVHQFNKVEQVIYTIADEEETIKWHEKMTQFSEKILQDLELPYQILAMCSGDMGAGQRKKYDIETWFPAQNKYRETHSASYFLDFQSRRLNIRYQDKKGELKHVYTLNNTVAASPRLLAAIIENYQQADGSIKVPTVLQKYVGKESISR